MLVRRTWKRNLRGKIIISINFVIKYNQLDRIYRAR